MSHEVRARLPERLPGGQPRSREEATAAAAWSLIDLSLV
jgi:hypothetical protein